MKHPPPNHAGPTKALHAAAAETPVRRLRGPRSTDELDAVAIEEPMEIQLGATSLAVVMRTPGHDEELVLGFLVTERVVERFEQIASVHHCSTATEAAEENVVRVTLAAGTEVDAESLRRNLFANSSCGICGKATIDNALAMAPPLDDETVIERSVLVGLPDRLRAAQTGFHATGGLHAAALATTAGELLVVREDVGRHNAVDKVIGWALAEDRLPLTDTVLVVSGRISFEIVQKALAARIPLIAAISAPTSLAVTMADQARITLVAFLRGDTMSLYSAAQRVR